MRRVLKTDTPGHIYFIDKVDKIKIGFTRDVSRRQAHLAGRLIGTLPASLAQEQQLHLLLSAYVASPCKLSREEVYLKDEDVWFVITMLLGKRAW